MSKTVLIVDDDRLNMKLSKDLLEANGYVTLQASNGRDGLDLARSHRPDLILMDIQLPEMSGLEVTGLLKQDPELRRIPVVAVTAHAMKGDEDRFRSAGCDDYLSRPVSITDLLATVQRYAG